MSQSTRSVTRHHWWPAERRPVAMRDLRLLTWVPIGALTGLLFWSVVAPTSAQAAALPLAVAGAIVGLPHGAVDHLVPWWWGEGETGLRGRARIMLAFVLGYTAAAGLALTSFLLAPTPTLTAFLVLSALHFGRAEVVVASERADRLPPGPADEWLLTVAHGVAVVGLLLWAAPAKTAALVRPLSPALVDAASATRGAGLVLVATLVLAATVDLLRRRRLQEAAELALVTLTFAVAPPLAAFGIYFAAWHALRHTGRLLDLAGPQAGWGQAAGRLARASALPTVVALAAIAALWWLRDLAGLQAQVAVLLALTLPHAAVVWALDRRGALAALGR